MNITDHAQLILDRDRRLQPQSEISTRLSFHQNAQYPSEHRELIKEALHSAAITTCHKASEPMDIFDFICFVEFL